MADLEMADFSEEVLLEICCLGRPILNPYAFSDLLIVLVDIFL